MEHLDTCEATFAVDCRLREFAGNKGTCILRHRFNMLLSFGIEKTNKSRCKVDTVQLSHMCETVFDQSVVMLCMYHNCSFILLRSDHHSTGNGRYTYCYVTDLAIAGVKQPQSYHPTKYT